MMLGALHGFEPGHSKTVMAAFIISIRGTVAQAVLLGLSATVSHTALIWILAFVGLHYSNQFNVETVEPYLQVATGAIVVGMAAWMLRRVRREKDVHHEHGPHGGTWMDTGHGFVEISVFETNVPPRFRLYFSPDKKSPVAPAPNQVATIETIRPDGARQMFAFEPCEGFLESTAEIPEPHEFRAILSVNHHGTAHTYETQFTEDEHHHEHAHGDDHSRPHEHGAASEDEHQRAHALDLQRRFANRNVTTWQIVLFGLTGGLLPCPSAFAVLLLCLQLKQFVLGFALVLAFSLGLALTLVSVGSIAAVMAGQATKRFSRLGELAHKVPYVSSTILVVVGVVVALTGVRHLLQ